MRLVLATRRSPLAMAQTEAVALALRGAGHEVELLPLVTTGDRWSAGQAAADVKGLFVKELEEALLDGRADLAVHSAKDLPGELPAGLAVLAVPPRADPRDVLVGPAGGLDGLPVGARVATGSPRRRAQLLAERPDLRMVDIRGNVGTRLAKLGRGEADALVLAAAGLARLGLAPAGAQPLDVEVCVPAPGQGCLALEGRADREDLAGALAPLADPEAHLCLRAERAFLAAVGGGCLAPVGALAQVDGGAMRLRTFVGSAGGSRDERRQVDGRADDPEGLARVAAATARGAGMNVAGADACGLPTARGGERHDAAAPDRLSTPGDPESLERPTGAPRRGLVVHLESDDPLDCCLLTPRGQGRHETADAAMHDRLGNAEEPESQRPTAAIRLRGVVHMEAVPEADEAALRDRLGDPDDSAALARPVGALRRSGVVHLVGAGPGDPGLLTVRGRELLEAADVVVHDRLGTEALLPLCRPDALLVNAGKEPGRVAMTQEQINAELVRHGSAGRAVVRLKGGDPFVFGRGGEEAEALTAAGVAFEVVPGITSAIAAPAYAGIPVTHRGVATAVTIVTGHEDPTKPSEQTDWAALAAAPGTLVVLMGMGRLAGIAEALIVGGRPADQPAAAVQWGTTPRQRRVLATLSTLAGACADTGLGSPAVVVVGPVARLAGSLGWWEVARPLAGRRVVVTRARAQASALSDRLRALGAEVVELLAIRIAPVADSPEIAAACAAIADYDLIALTSANGVDALFDQLAERGRDARALRPETDVIAIGPATADALAARGVRADVVPERFVAEGILDALAGRDLAGARVLVARAREARPDLVDGLRARGADVDEVALYDTVPQPADPDELERALSADYLTFTSSSTVRNFLALLDHDARRRLAAARVVSIGPITSQTVRAEGLEVHAEAGELTIDGLVEALLRDVHTRRDRGPG